MPTSREERMRALTGEVRPDVAGVVVLVERLAGAIADVQATLEAKLQTDVPPSVTVGGWFDDLRADLRVRDESIRGLLEVAAAERVNIRADLDAATEERVAIASRLDAVEAKLDQVLARLEAPLYVADNELVPETPAPVVIPDPGGEFVEVPPVPADQDLPIVPANSLDDLADLFADPPAEEPAVDPAPAADDGSAS